VEGKKVLRFTKIVDQDVIAIAELAAIKARMYPNL
jgi:hypothetical protein